MSDQNPNSVLFSLEELRRIEEERVTAEQDAQHRARQAEEQAKLDAERQAREQEEARIRAEEAQQRADQEAKDHADREERIRIAEAERRARVEAEMQLQQQRIAAAADADARVKARRLRNTILGIAGVAILLLGGLGYWLYLKNVETLKGEQALAAQKKALEKARNAASKEQRQFQQKQLALENEKKALTARLATAKTDAEKKLLKKQLGARLRRESALSEARRRAKIRARRRAKRIRLRKGNDPLGGLKL